jgi:hypothetical protein
VGEDAAALDEEAGVGGVEGSPAGVGLLGDEDFAFEARGARVANHFDCSHDDAGAAAEALQLRGCRGDLRRRRASNGAGQVGQAAGLEAARRGSGGRILPGVVLAASEGHKGAQIGGNGGAFDVGPHFVDGEIEDVVGAVENAVTLERGANGAEHGAEDVEDLGSCQAHFFAVADAEAGVLQDPTKQALARRSAAGAGNQPLCFLLVLIANLPFALTKIFELPPGARVHGEIVLD